MTRLRDAVRLPPRALLSTLWPVRALAYVLTGAVSGAVTLVWIVLTSVGAPALAAPFISVERHRLALLGCAPPAAPRVRHRYTDPVAWRAFAYLVLHATALLLLDAAAVAVAFWPVLLIGGGTFTRAAGGGDAVDVWAGVVVGVLVLLAVVVVAVLAVYVVMLAALAHAELARLLLAPPDDAVARSRSRLVDAFESERRRIERDLHDGAQQRLLELGLTLVAAELELDDDPAAAKPLLRKASGQAKAALAELRELVRGIHPRVLTDLGLAAAVAELADRASVPTTVDVVLPARPPSTVESAAYFVVAEALANVRHAAAERVTVTARRLGPALVVRVRDDGTGGADPAKGTGLTGLADRVAAHGGTLRLSSPAGGPTVLTVTLPW
ncbi:histidine kinase [Virgisporangium aliadipatigenens]|uniref:histidine kinase n=1 Tax=Virgisporangium aliadipatigenens TaxID=741659 RepID=A0A8J3YYC4_9ACTN|nr:histidine kinase [Virgisporangium aliadipatigenens]GIJ51950.1 histidine kinase [Virgisporangium aliadipatigenens]